MEKGGNMKFIIALLFLFSQALICDTNDTSISFRPCRSWSYNFDSHGYVCNFPDSYTTVPSYYDFQALEKRVTDLEQQLRILEIKVLELEKNHPGSE